MSEQTVANVVIAAIAVVPPTLMALASFVQSWRNGKKSDEIHVLVNSNMAAVKAELAAAKLEIADLRSIIVKRET